MTEPMTKSEADRTKRGRYKEPKMERAEELLQRARNLTNMIVMMEHERAVALVEAQFLLLQVRGEV